MYITNTNINTFYPTTPPSILNGLSYQTQILASFFDAKIVSKVLLLLLSCKSVQLLSFGSVETHRRSIFIVVDITTKRRQGIVKMVLIGYLLLRCALLLLLNPPAQRLLMDCFCCCCFEAKVENFKKVLFILKI